MPDDVVVHATDDVEEYAAQVTPFLEADPVERNVLLTVMVQALNGATWSGPPQFWWLTQAGAVVGASSWTPVYPLLISSVPYGAAAALADSALERAAAIDVRLPGVTGPRDSAGDVAAVLAERTEMHVTENMRMIVHDLPDIHDVPEPPGGTRVAFPNEAPLVAEWMRAFAEDVRATHGNIATSVRAAIEQRRILLWVDGGVPRSTAARQPAVGGVTRIGAVYTPPEHRGHGYARRLVYEVSRYALGGPGVRTCTLNTDATNPVSNAIYRQIGYRPVAEHSEYLLVP
ncbi:MAG: GNAT family N-acetyltransferase [Candidatus Dormibacteria bacterium]